MRTRDLVAVLVAAVLSAPLAAANFRLSDGQSFSDVDTGSEPPLVTSDGRWVFYRHDADTDEAVELWRVAGLGGAPERISGLLPTGASVFGERLTPDGERILFLSPQDDVEAHELFSAPVDAPPGSYVQISAPLPPGFHIFWYSDVSADSARLAYVVQPYLPGAVGNPQLWIAEVDGGGQTAIVDLPSGRSFGGLAVTHDFSRAVYPADAIVAGRFDLFSVPTTGGTPIQLNGALVGGGDVSQVLASPTAGLVAYLADQQVDERFELYVVPAGGGVATKVSGALAAGHDVAGFVFAPDGARLLYFETDAGGLITEIWSVAPDGSGRVGLLGALVAGGQPIEIRFDSTHAVFVADKLVDETFELFSVPLVGGAVTKLNPALPAGGDVAAGQNAGPKITPDGTRVVYAADQQTNGIENVYVVPIGGGPAVAVGRVTTVGSAEVRGLTISPDGERVARVSWYRALVGQPAFVHLAVARLDGGRWTTVDSCIETGEVWHHPVFSSADSRSVFYVADQEVDEQWELHAGDDCLLCDGFEVGSTVRWSAELP